MKACFHENNDIYRVHAYLLLFETATQPSSAQLKRKKLYSNIVLEFIQIS